MRQLILSFLFLSSSLYLGLAQGDPIYLVNPSFEDYPRQGKPPRGWYDCGFPSETPPDVQPSDNASFAYFQVSKQAFEGSTYLGMVVRDNDTWESVAQRLSAPLEGGQCYDFSISLSRSELYVSPSRTTNEETNYTTPATLRIWGGSGYCNKAELLAETKEIINTRWLKYEFKLEPSQNHTYIVMEAFYKTPTLFPYNGNVLVDDASPIVPVPCDDEIVSADPPPPPPTPEPPRNKETEQSENNGTQNEQEQNASSEESKPKILEELDRSKLVRGQTILIENLYFEADSSKIKEESFDVLEEIFSFLNSNQDVIVEIGGHTNGNPPHYYCDQLSKARAKAVAGYLMNRGINEDRLQYKGYGKRNPIASNRTAEGRRKNQRVEIKILSFDG